MNYFDLYSSYPDHTIAVAWDSQVGDGVAIPFMVREPHHGRDRFVVNSNTYPFALSTSKGSERIATPSLKEKDKTPWLADTLTECGDELFARFAACYAELRALPRRARRTLQRQLARSSDIAAILPQYLQGGRRLQHRMAWSLAGAALLLALGQGVATAATITVTTNNPNIASDGQCSLIEAIVNANNDAATHADCAGGQRRGHDCPAGKRQRDTLKRRRGNPIWLPRRSAFDYQSDHYRRQRRYNCSPTECTRLRPHGRRELRGSDASECDSARRIFLRRFVE